MREYDEDDNRIREIDSNLHLMFKCPEYKWKCELFGTGPNGMVLHTETAPNWFHRMTQRILFGNKWTKL